MKTRIRALLLAAMFVVSLLPVMSMADSNVAEFDGTGYSKLQDALNDAYDAGGTVEVRIIADVDEGDVTIKEKTGLHLTVTGTQGCTVYSRVILYGNSSAESDHSTKLVGIAFDAKNGAAECISVPDSGGRYTQYVTVENCTFTDSGATNKDATAIRQATGGCKDWTITGCSVDATMHSLAQIKNVEQNLEFVGCTVNSKNGVNMNSTLNAKFNDCDFDVAGYAVRVGVDGSGTKGPQVTLVDCSVKTSGAEGDAAIIIRSGATAAKLEIEGCTVEAGQNMPAISNTAGSGVTVTVEDCQGIGEEGENGVWDTVEIPVVVPAYAGPAMNWVKVNTVENGVVKSGPLAASAGATITLYPKAAEGYVLDTVEVLDAAGNAIELDGLKFAVPAGGVTVNATFKLAE